MLANLHPLLEGVFDDPVPIGKLEVPTLDLFGEDASVMHVEARAGGHLFAGHPEFAWMILVIHRMEFSFFPTMRIHASQAILAALHIIHDEVRGFPVLTLDRLVIVFVRFPAVVLPVMGVNAEGFVMLGEVVDRK